MSKSRSLLAAITLLLVTGAGCFGLGGDSTVSVATGGLWASGDSGNTWSAKSVLLTAAGNATISGLDILSMEQDPSDDSVLYVGSKTSGLFYSYDSGESWQRPEDPAAMTGSVLAIEVDPRNVCTYYVLKSDRVLKTTTCGREFDTETYVETRVDESLTTLSLDWYNPDTLFVGTTDGDLIRSLDGGETWTAILRTGNTIKSVLISNADSRIVLVGTRTRGMHRSTDGGATWVKLEDIVDEDDARRTYGFSQTSDGSRIIMSSAYGLLRSDDSGATWSNLELVTEAGDVQVSAVAIAKTNKDLIYYTAGTIFYTSTSGGQAWSTVNQPTTREVSVIHVDQADDEHVFLGSIAIEE